VAIAEGAPSAIARTDPNFQNTIEKTTVCSFIHADEVNGRVNVRAKPDPNAPIVARLKRGDGVRATKRTGEWVEIVARDTSSDPLKPRYAPLRGYVSNRFINGCSEDRFDRWRR
jgi:hypothetical protein